MHILVATGLYPPESGGPATYSLLLEEELPKRNVHVTVLPFSEVRHLPVVIRHLVYAIKIITRGKKVTHILALDPHSVGAPAWVASLFRMKPFYVKIVGDYAWEQGVQRFGVKDGLDEFVTKKDYGFFISLLKFIESFVAHRARKVIVPSRYLKRIVHTWGVSEGKIVVVPNAAPKLSRTHKSTLRSVLKYHELMILSIGRLVPWKGVMGAIHAIEKIAPEIGTFKFVIVGDGPELSRLEAEVERVGLQDRIVFTGQLPHEITLRYLNAADILILNTSYEGFSHLLLESLALGTSVVTTPVGGNPEIIEHARNGLLVPYNNISALAEAVKSLAHDDRLRQTFAQAGRRTAERFTRDKTVSGLLKALS